jgi:hypothetical protein
VRRAHFGRWILVIDSLSDPMANSRRATSKRPPARRALCVGINDYPGTGSDLRGCVNDAKDWKRALESRGYEVALLLDRQATAAGVTRALEALIGPAGRGDSLVFTFSGHGSWLPDGDSDEADGRDEMLCPHDVADQRYLLDDDLAELFALKPRGARLTFVSDSCHSGTVSRIFPADERLTARTAPRPRFLHPETFVRSPKQLRAIRRVALAPRTTRQKYPALLAAGCRDHEFSWDAHFGNRPNGAFTYHALRALAKKPRTPAAWMKAIRQSLPSTAHPQTPSLYGSSSAKSGALF